MSDKTKILVVDDTRLNRKILWYMLCERYDILEAENGKEALEILEQEGSQIGLILLDLIMPVMDGMEFLERKAEIPEYGEIPVMVCMAEPQLRAEEKCLQIGVIDFVRKPYNPDVTSLRIQNSLELWKQLQKEKKMVTNVLNRYMDPKVVKDVLSQEENGLDNKYRNITVIFADICGFTSRSEHMEPEALLNMLNQCCSVAGHCIKKYHGTLDKIIGDCVMAFWGAPEPCEDDAYLACAAALEIQESIEIVNQDPQFSEHPIKFSIGINKGDAVVGNVGMEDYMNYTAVGDTVNTASRLESAAGVGEIYISRSVADALGDRAVYTSLGKFALKGKKENFEVLRLEKLMGPR